MNDTQRSAFEGITKMELELRRGPFGVEDLLHYAQSVNLCHVVAEATDDESLGRFYAENGFIAEVDDLADEVFELLDFAKLGKNRRREEKGVFTRNGYVVLTESIDRTPIAVPVQPQKPSYVFLLKLEPYSMESERPPVAELRLPASEEQLQQVVAKLAIENWSEGLYTIEDSVIPDALDESDTLASIRKLNKLAKVIEGLPTEALPKYKALLEATQCGSIETALNCASSLDQYTLDGNARSYKQIAKDDVYSISNGRTVDLLVKHLDLESYGRELVDQEHGSLTPYGYLTHNDLEPIISARQRFAMYMEDGYGAMAGGLPEGYIDARNRSEAERILRDSGVDTTQITLVPEVHIESEESGMNAFDRGRQMAELNKKLYPPGTRIELISMGNDPHPIESGTRGTVDLVDDMGTLHCSFDNGRKLGVCLEEDSIRVIQEQEVVTQNQATEPEQGPEMGSMSM